MGSKTRLTLDAVQAFVRAQFAADITDFARMVEGESSQAFTFAHADGAYVVRVNRSITGFLKDAYAYEHFHGAAIPIPPVIAVGQIDADHAFCIAAKLPGITLQDCDVGVLEPLLAPTFATWRAIGACDIAATTGFGYYNAAGVGQFATWRDYLAALLDRGDYDWDYIARQVGDRWLATLMAHFTDLLDQCPEERRLVHGDFGANNLLVAAQRVTAVLDWDCAKYGDPLYDVATAYFWRPWLACMDRQATYYATNLADLPGYEARVACYQLRIGLAEIYDAVIAQEWWLVEWLVRRCTDIVKGINDGRAV